MQLTGCQLLQDAEFYVAIDGKGLWPNLTRLPSGTLAAAVYNHPSHGMGSGSNVEFWASDDDGCSWSFRSTLSDVGDDPESIRMNHAVGLSERGTLVALVSGYQSGQRLPFLPLQCCLSDDEGRTWRRHLLPNEGVPFGDILPLPDGRLVCSLYRRTADTPRRSQTSLAFSEDGGVTWTAGPAIADGSEAHLLRCRNGTWLAAVRANCPDRLDGALPHGGGEWLYRSDDNGKSWSEGKPISPQGQENAHLMQLRDGALICCFTSRIPGLFGVVARRSEDGGTTWSVPVVLIGSPACDWHRTDCGYPSSIELDDGTVVTAHYFGPKRPEWAAFGLPWHQRYHMGIIRWHPARVQWTHLPH